MPTQDAAHRVQPQRIHRHHRIPTGIAERIPIHPRNRIPAAVHAVLGQVEAVVVVPDALDAIVPLAREAEELDDVGAVVVGVGVDADVSGLEVGEGVGAGAAKGSIPGPPDNGTGVVDESSWRGEVVVQVEEDVGDEVVFEGDVEDGGEAVLGEDYGELQFSRETVHLVGDQAVGEEPVADIDVAVAVGVDVAANSDLVGAVDVMEDGAVGIGDLFDAV